MKIYKVRLTKVESNHNNIRTNSMEGETTELPVPGENFVIVGDPINPMADVRCITTSEIQLVEKTDSLYTFKTLNSTYQLEVLSEEDLL